MVGVEQLDGAAMGYVGESCLVTGDCLVGKVLEDLL